jgi:Ca2+-binding RTX toxin-like protein
VRLGAANDTVGGGPGSDELFGGGGADLFYGGPGNGNDAVVAGAGNDLVFVGGGNDSVNGNAGADEIFSGPGRDTVEGGAGRDKIYGGPGDDIFYGDNAGGTGAGRDIFLFFRGNGNDTVEDFNTNVDRIDADAPFGTLSFGQNAEGDAVLSFADVTVTFTGVTAAELDDPTLFL